MKCCILAFTFVALLMVSNYNKVSCSPYVTNDDGLLTNDVEDMMQQFSNQAEKRACVRRGGNCDHRPNDCCFNSSCRCNLWGSNCRCQRMGLFQKWG